MKGTGERREGVQSCRKCLEERLCRKVARELTRFKRQMMQKGKEEIFQSAYKIDSIVCIYETLLEASRKMEDEALAVAVEFPGLLAFLYGRWLKYEDSYVEDMECCVNGELSGIGSGHGRRGKETEA